MIAFTFAGHLLDVARRELRCSSQLISLEPQVFDLLVYLVANRERVVGKDELIASVWGGPIVSESAVTTRINAARRAVGDSATYDFGAGSAGLAATRQAVDCGAALPEHVRCPGAGIFRGWQPVVSDSSTLTVTEPPTE